MTATARGTDLAGVDAVRFEGVSKRFGDTAALRDVSLSIARGELMTLLGPSGCGKTTLLNLVAGFFSPDAGAILIDGETVNDVPTYRRQVGLMFQSYALFPHMTVAANVAYGLKARHVRKHEIGRRVADALALVKLTGLEDRKPRQLSGGQQQRVALARALVINPKVLLLDEPFSALDKNLRGSMQVELREIQRKLGVTTIFVTHDQSEALSLSDRIAVMADGVIRQLGTPADIYGSPSDRFVAGFVGDANVLRGRLVRIDGARATVVLGSNEISVPTSLLRGVTEASAVDLFVRPEQIRVSESANSGTSLGTIAGQIYQGGHLDLHIEWPHCKSGRVIVRLSGDDATRSWPIGTKVEIAVVVGSAVVGFPAS